MIFLNSFRKLFWSDWNRDDPKIESANLDGSERRILAKSPQVKLPNSLAISLNSGEVCFADAGAGNQKIECEYFNKIFMDDRNSIKSKFQALTLTLNNPELLLEICHIRLDSPSRMNNSTGLIGQPKKSNLLPLMVFAIQEFKLHFSAVIRCME